MTRTRDGRYGRRRAGKDGDKTPQIVVSKTLDKVAWKTSRVVHHIDEIRNLKQQRGKNMHVVGGATLVGSLMNASLIDEVQLIVNPLLLGGGRGLFKDVKERTALKQI